MLPKTSRTLLTTLYATLLLSGALLLLTVSEVSFVRSDFLKIPIALLLWFALIGTPFITAISAIYTWKYRAGSKQISVFTWGCFGWFVLHTFILVWLFFFAMESTSNPSGNSALDWLLHYYGLFVYPALSALALYLLTPTKKRATTHE